MPFNETSQELNHRYGQTFIGLRTGKDIVPVYVREFGGEKKNVRLISGASYTSPQGAVAHEVFQREVAYDEIVWAAPHLGYVQCADRHTKFVSRQPEARPAKTRGLMPSLVNYWYWGKNIGDWVIHRMSDLFNYGDSAWDVYALYNPKYSAPEEAWKAIRNGEWQGAAISRNIALFKNRVSKSPVVFYKDLAVGLYDKDSNKVFLRPRAHLLFEEISNYVACEKVDGEERPINKELPVLDEEILKAADLIQPRVRLAEIQRQMQQVRPLFAQPMRADQWLAADLGEVELRVGAINAVEAEEEEVQPIEIDEEENDNPNW